MFWQLPGDTPLRRACLRPVIDRVDVDEAEIRLSGRKTVLEAHVISGRGRRLPERTVLFRKWRAREDKTGHSYVIVITDVL